MPESERLAPAALKTPPPIPRPPAPPGAAGAAYGVLAVGTGATVKASADTTTPTGTSVPADGQVGGNHAIGDGESPGRIEDSTSPAIRPG